jgi:hypothetical protein
MKTRMRIAELIEDLGIYPRSQVDDVNIARLRDVYVNLGKFDSLPVVDVKSKRIIDGVHRIRVLRRELGDEAEIEVEAQSYKNEQEMYLDAIRLNSHHGKNITGSEMITCLIKGMDIWKLQHEPLARAFGITVERVEAIVSVCVGKVTGPHVRHVAIKRCVRHLSERDQKFTLDEVLAMDGLPGQEQLLLIRQLCTIVERGWLNLDNDKILLETRRLLALLENLDLKRQVSA